MKGSLDIVNSLEATLFNLSRNIWPEARNIIRLKLQERISKRSPICVVIRLSFAIFTSINKEVTACGVDIMKWRTEVDTSKIVTRRSRSARAVLAADDIVWACRRARTNDLTIHMFITSTTRNKQIDRITEPGDEHKWIRLIFRFFH